MADIQFYNTQLGNEADIPTRRATADDFGGGSAAATIAIGGAIAQAGQDYYDLQQERETSDVRTKLAQARAKWTVELANRAERGELANDDFSDKFVGELQNDLDSIGANYGTTGAQKAYREGSATLAAALMQNAGVYQAQAVGAKAKQDYVSYVDAHQNTLLRDPSQLNEILTESMAALNDPTGPYARLPKGARDELTRTTREQLTKSAALGAIRINPTGAKELLEAGAFEGLRGEDTIMLMNQADSAIQGEMIEQERAIRLAEKAQKDAQEATLNKFIGALVADPNGLSAMDVVNSNLDPSQKVQVLGYIKKGLDGTRDDKNTAMPDLFMRIHLPTGDPNKITNEEQLYPFVDSGGLSMDGLQKLRGELSGNSTVEGDIEGALKKNFLAGAKTAITGTNEMLGMRDPKGDENYLRFMSAFLTDYATQREAGKTPQQLLNPDSPDYLGKTIGNYKRTPQEMMEDLMTGGLTPDAGTPGGASGVRRLNPGEFVQNADGTQSTERLMTVTNPRLNGGKPTNIPSIWHVDGQIVELPFGERGTEDRAVDYALRSGESWQSFESIDAAVEAAKVRSANGGRFQDGVAQPKSKAEYDALPSGTKYIKNGVVKVKP